MGVGRQPGQDLQGILQTIGPVAGDAGGPGAVLREVGARKQIDQIRRGHLVRGQHPDAFVGPLPPRLGRRRSGDPGHGGCGHGIGGPVLQDPRGELPVPALGREQLVEEDRQGGLLQRRRPQRRSALGGDAPDAAARLVAVGMAEAGLVVADQGVEPVAEIEGSVGTEAHIHDAEGGVGRFDERGQAFDVEGRPARGDAEALDAVVQVAAGHEFPAVLGAPVTVVGDVGAAEFAALVPERRMGLEVLGADHRLGEVGDAMAVPGEDEGLARAIEGGAEGVVRAHGAVPEGVEPQATGPEAPDAGLMQGLVAPGGLDAADGVQALAHHQLTGRSPREGVDRLVGVTGAEAAEDHPPLIGLAVAVGVLEEEQLVGRTHVHAAVAELEPEGHVQLVVEDGGPVGLPVVIGVLEHDDAVPRLFAGADLRVAGGGGDPQATVAVEADLGGFDHAIGLAGEEADFVAIGNLQRGPFLGRALVGLDDGGYSERRDEEGAGEAVSVAPGETKGGHGVQRVFSVGFRRWASASVLRSAACRRGTNCSISAGNHRIFRSRWSRLLGCSVRSPARKAQLVGRV